jgi:hypothetical protein
VLYAYHAAYYIPEAGAVTGTVNASLGGLSATVAGTRTTPGTVNASLGGLSATVAGTRTTSGSIAAPLGALSANVVGSVAGAIPGAIAVDLGALTATLVQYVPPPAVESGSWGPLLALVREARTYRPPPRPVACPNDGEPLQLVRGRLHCKYDGWEG